VFDHAHGRIERVSTEALRYVQKDALLNAGA
jgi:hypothetical protein